MPELPEVETTVAGLRSVLDGAQLTSVETRRADMRFPFPPDLRQRLTGATVTGLGRRAKYGLIETNRGDTMIFHLGMSGRWRIDPAEIAKHDHLLVETPRHRLALYDPRRFGFVHLVETAKLADYPHFKALGPEPLSDAFDAAYLAKALDNRIAPIKAMLLDQRIVAGLGNIYVCEALFRSGISPRKLAGVIRKDKLEKLSVEVRKVIEEAIEAGGSTISDFETTTGELGYFQHRFQAYDREGDPCVVCARPIKRIVQSGRSTFYCSSCQK